MKLLATVFAAVGVSMQCTLPAALLFSQEPSQPQEAVLDRLGIKCTHDAQRRLVAVQLPRHSTDWEIEALLGFPSIREISAHGCKATAATVKELERLPTLVAVDFTGVKGANDYAAALRNMPHLRSISLAYSDLSNSGLDELCRSHSRLRELNVSGTKITDLAIDSIRSLSDLEVLGISNTAIENGRHSLESLGPIAGLAQLAYLKRITLGGHEMQLSPRDLEAFSYCCNLEGMALGSARLGRVHLESLLSLQTASPELRLAPYIAKVQGMRVELNEKGSIESLAGTYPQLSMLPQAQLRMLKRLNVIGADSLGFIKSLPNLSELRLDSRPQDPNELAVLASVPALDTLRLSRMHIDARVVTILLTQASPKLIIVENCVVDPDASALLEQAENGADRRVIIRRSSPR